ncbi:LPS export ABC transporter periplasmic protein LptC [Flavobacterium sp. SUN052]|uniref:LPS export ABC transporter periplasmic protein LptC n=1 Tax=Flavobacterium sp. SUN052 TaxID=3002441 RepID=UPI00237D5A52|nr:LPS export ABC transporter periplasmic protein LptC [Flavobacterium sp. SUN052]MEC4004617.1 LPS export ABC transporter periplasmic protein LptC [Flavobacterium sp. SUN052]
MITTKKITILLSTIVVILFLSSCESNFKEVQKSTFADFNASGEADSINIKYTDSGRIKSVLLSSKMLDYATVEFPFTEFPKGMNVTLYDENGKKTFVTAKYAVTFKNTDLIDLQGNVKISNETGQLFETEQLYFDQKNEWFYTEKRYKFTDPKGVSYGEGVDFSKDFKIITSQAVSGEVQNTK